MASRSPLLAYQLGGPRQDAPALARQRALPGAIAGAPGRFDGGRRVVGAAGGERRVRAGAARIEALHRAAVGRRQPAAIDEMPVRQAWQDTGPLHLSKDVGVHLTSCARSPGSWTWPAIPGSTSMPQPGSSDTVTSPASTR